MKSEANCLARLENKSLKLIQALVFAQWYPKTHSMTLTIKKDRAKGLLEFKILLLMRSTNDTLSVRGTGDGKYIWQHNDKDNHCLLFCLTIPGDIYTMVLMLLFSISPLHKIIHHSKKYASLWKECFKLKMEIQMVILGKTALFISINIWRACSPFLTRPSY